MPSNQDVACSFFNVGACVQFFTTIRKLGNKFGNVSRLRVWAPNEPKPGCSRLVLLCAASHASANQWANKLEMHRRVQIHTCLLSPVPLLSTRSLDMTRWKGTRETRLRLQRPGIRLSLLYSLSPRAPLWPPDPPLQAALVIMFVPVEFHKCCPPCPMVKKNTRLLDLQRVLEVVQWLGNAGWKVLWSKK